MKESVTYNHLSIHPVSQPTNYLNLTPENFSCAEKKIK